MKNYLNNFNFEKVVFILLAGYILVLPIAHTTTIRAIFFFSLLILTVFYSFTKKSKLEIPFFKCWMLYLLISILSLYYAINKTYSITEIKNEIIYTLIIIWITTSWIKDKKNFLRLITVLIIGNSILVIIAIIKGLYIMIKINELFIQSAPLDIGVGKFSSYIILVIPLIFAATILYLKNNKINKTLLLCLLCFLNLVALYFTGNRIVWFAFLIELILLIYLLYYYKVFFSNKRTVFFIIFAFLAVGIVLNFIVLKNRADNNSIYEYNTPFYKILTLKIQKSLEDDPRIKIWKVAIKNIRENPMSGGGFGREAFKLLNPDFVKTQPFSWHAHNIFLNKGVQMGIPGVIIFVILFTALIKKFFNLCNKIKNNNDNKEFIIYPIAGIVITIGVIIKNLTDDFFIRDYAWLFWIITVSIIRTFEIQNR